MLGLTPSNIAKDELLLWARIFCGGSKEAVLNSFRMKDFFKSLVHYKSLTWNISMNKGNNQRLLSSNWNLITDMWFWKSSTCMSLYFDTFWKTHWCLMQNWTRSCVDFSLTYFMLAPHFLFECALPLMQINGRFTTRKTNENFSALLELEESSRHTISGQICC